MRIDVHHHALPPFYLEALRAADYPRRSGIRFPEWRPRDSLEVMDRHGIDVAVLSVSTPGVAFCESPAAARELARRCNQWAAETVEAHPGRFAALACLPLPDVDAAVAEVAYALDVLGLHGVTLLSSAGGRYPGDPTLEPLMAALDERRAPAFLHPTSPAGGAPPGLDIPVFAVEFVADTTRAIANLILSGTLEAHPGISFVCAHGGGFAPYIVSRLEAAWARSPEPALRAPAGVLASLRRLHYDTAGVANPYALPALLALAGTERLCLGTDFPFVSERLVADGLAGLAGLPQVAGNALRLLPGWAGSAGS
ncbi:MAG: amidohydrolase family protein [Acidimicrobiia bacterium]